MELKTILETSDLQKAITASSFESLRTRKPEFEGQILYLSSYHLLAGNPAGGGYFLGHLTSGADDGGMHAAGDKFHWERICSSFSDEINITHFGAYMDGINDDLPAVLRMFNYGRNIDGNHRMARRIGVKFPSGVSFVSPYDYGTAEIDYLQFTGPRVDFGLMPETRIVSDKSDTPVIKCSARRFAIQGIEWDGQATSTITDGGMRWNFTTPSNKQPFFANVETAGQFVNVSCFRAINSGGIVFDLLDTLDTHFDQIYCNRIYDDFIRILWSNDPQGKWDHSTAVEITNGNLQYMLSDNGLNMPRCTQSLIRNLWIEHSNGPGDLSNGGWDIHKLSIESSKFPLNLKGTRGKHNIELQTGGAVVRGTPEQRWLSNYEDGYITESAQATSFEQPIRVLFQGGTLHGDNNTSASTWVCIGQFFSPSVGQQWEVDIHAKNGYSSAGASPTIERNGEPGKTTIKIQRGSGNEPIVTASHEGMAGVTDIRYQAPYNTYVKLWIKLPQWCGRFDVNVYSNGVNRQDAGTPSMFLKDGTKSANEPVAAAGENPIRLPEYRFAKHANGAGVGAAGGVLQLSSPPGTPSSTAAPAEYMQILDRNGKVAYIPLYR